MATNKKRERSSRQGRRTKATPLVTLSTDQIKRMPKPHTGYEAFVPEVIALYDAKKDELGISGLDGAPITDAIEKFNSLREAEVAAVEKLAQIQGTRLYYNSTAYTLVLEMYARLQRAARTNPAVKRAIAAFSEFMKHNSQHKSDSPKPTTSATTTTPTNGSGGSSTPSGGSSS